MPRVKCWQVDAFTNRPFAGNPAAICWLEQEADPAWMQAVAAEMNLAETAFVRPLTDGHELRWFTPVVEVDLCGHATLASAHTVWSAGLADDSIPLRFQTRSGELTCTRSGDLIALDFPALPPTPAVPPVNLLPALGIESALYVGRTIYDYLVVVPSEAAVLAVRPDFRRLRDINMRGV
ncbi:MAG: oxidoreductase, partial [Acidobacteriia bacterium 12-62-4]